MKKLLLLSLLLSASFFPAFKTNAKDNQPVKAVIISGQNNHNWPVSSVTLEKILKDSGLFDVTLVYSPGQGQDMTGFNVDFKSYDVVIMDYNGDSWNQKMRDDFVEYARNGGGIVFYHAADNAFRNWEEYNRMIALGGWEGRNEQDGPYVYYKGKKLFRDMTPGPGGSHGAQHEYMMNRHSHHPVTKAFPKQWLHAQDELYDHMRGPGNIKKVLYSAYADPELGGSGHEEPLVFTVDYGKARIMHIMIGHAGPTTAINPAMDCPGFKTLLLRSAQWCARRKPTVKYTPAK